MLYQGSKSEDSWYFYINTMNDSTLAFNFTRNYLQVREDLLTAVSPVDSGDVCAWTGQTMEV